MGEQRQQIQADVITWFKGNPGEIVTLAELQEVTGAKVRSSVSAVVTRLIKGNMMPGRIEIVTRGVYKYWPREMLKDEKTEKEKTEKTEKADVKLRYREVGRINDTTVVLTDSRGNIWRAERLQ